MCPDGANSSLIFSMIVRRTWSSCREDVRALPSSWKTLTSLLISGTSRGIGRIAGAVPHRQRASSRELCRTRSVRNHRAWRLGIQEVNTFIIVNRFHPPQRAFRRDCRKANGFLACERCIFHVALTLPRPTPIFFVGPLRMSSTPFGEHLRVEREMRGVSLGGNFSAATRISTRFLEAIEKDQWEQLPGGVFNRGIHTVDRAISRAR